MVLQNYKSFNMKFFASVEHGTANKCVCVYTTYMCTCAYHMYNFNMAIPYQLSCSVATWLCTTTIEKNNQIYMLSVYGI